jgi:hypothetical protein
MKRSLLFTVVAVITLAAFAQDKPVEDPAKLKLAEQPLELSDLTDALGVRIWKVNATFPPNTDKLKVSLEIRQPDDSTTEITRTAMGSLAKFNVHEGEIVVAVSYPDGEGQFRSEKMHCFLRAMSGSDAKGVENPFKGASKMFFPSLSSQKVENGESLLLQSKTEDDHDGPRLVLKIVTLE